MTRRRRLPSGLRDRDGRWSYEVRHARLRGGRMVVALRTGELDTAIQRRAAIRTLMDRGDWEVLDRLRDGGLHVTDVVAAVREGEVRQLRKVGHALTRLEDAVGRFLQRTEATLSAATHRQYEIACRCLAGHLGDDYRMEDLTRQEAEAVLHGPQPTMPDQGVWSPARQKLSRTVYGALWRMAIEDAAEAADQAGLDPVLHRNPWRKTTVAGVRRSRSAFLAPPEWVHLLASVRGTEYAALLALAFRAGLRQGEIRHLRTDVDIELDGSEPLIRVQSRTGQHAWRPKHEHSERDVPVTPDLLEILREHVVEGFAGQRYFIRVPGKDAPISESAATKWTRVCYEAAGIQYGRDGDGLTLHSGRHTYASWLAQAGVPLNIVADLLGDTMQVVYDTYAHLVPQTLRDSAMEGYRMVEDAAPKKQRPRQRRSPE